MSVGAGGVRNKEVGLCLQCCVCHCLYLPLSLSPVFHLAVRHAPVLDVCGLVLSKKLQR